MNVNVHQMVGFTCSLQNYLPSYKEPHQTWQHGETCNIKPDISIILLVKYTIYFIKSHTGWYKQPLGKTYYKGTFIFYFIHIWLHILMEETQLMKILFANGHRKGDVAFYFKVYIWFVGLSLCSFLSIPYNFHVDSENCDKIHLKRPTIPL